MWKATSEHPLSVVRRASDVLGAVECVVEACASDTGGLRGVAPALLASMSVAVLFATTRIDASKFLRLKTEIRLAG